MLVEPRNSRSRQLSVSRRYTLTRIEVPVAVCDGLLPYLTASVHSAYQGSGSTGVCCGE